MTNKQIFDKGDRCAESPLKTISIIGVKSIPPQKAIMIKDHKLTLVEVWYPDNKNMIVTDRKVR